MVTASLKTLPIKSSGTKLGQRKKECNISISAFSPSCKHDYNFFNILNGRSLNLRILMSYLNFFNVVEGNAFMNRYFMNSPLICAIQTTLSLCILVALHLMESSPHVSWICWIIDLSHTHLLFASWIASISKWFDDVTTIICLTDLHEIVVPLQLNTYLVCDLPLCGFERNLAFVYLSNQLLWFPWVK